MRFLFQKLRRRTGGPGPSPAILMYHRIATLGWIRGGSPCSRTASSSTSRSSAARAARCRCPSSWADWSAARCPTTPWQSPLTTGTPTTCTQASPRLASARVPATLFLATGFVGQRHEYWWDELARGILLRTGAVDAEVTIGRERFCSYSVTATNVTAGGEPGSNRGPTVRAHTSRRGNAFALLHQPNGTTRWFGCGLNSTFRHQIPRTCR